MIKTLSTIHLFSIPTLLLFLVSSCISKKEIYKAYSRKECESFRPMFDNYKIKNGDVVADIGAANGWLEGVFSAMCDSVKFYIQDINTKRLNEYQFNKVIKYYSSIKSSRQTNSFKMVIGSEKKTDLPDTLFNKIIIHNTFHELIDPSSIIQDLTKKIKSNGEIFVSDQFSNEYKKILHKGCGIPAEKVSSIIDRFDISGLYLTGMTEPDNSLENYLRFESNKQKSADFKIKKNSVDIFVKELDKLNLTKINSDSVASRIIALNVKLHIKEIKNIYPSIEHYINSLGYILLRDIQIKSAINVLEANVTLFPESSNTYDSLGEAYLADKNYSLSLNNYKKSLLLNPDNENAKTKITEINQTASKRQ